MIMNRPACAQTVLGPGAYSQWRASQIGVITDTLERQLILELAGELGGRRVLDVGCGDGEFAVGIAERGAITKGIDASAAMIEAAKRRASQRGLNVDFQVASAQNLPFPAEQFDIVTAITILCFVEDAGPVFREIARVLRPGGRLVIGELGKWSAWAAERRIRGWAGSSLWRQAWFRTAGELRELAAQAGLVVERVRGAIYYPRWPVAAHLLSRYDSTLGRMTTLGAAFIALSATKPGCG